MNIESWPQKFNIENSPLREAYELLGAESPSELNSKFTEAQREPFMSGSWDLDDPNQIQNKIKDILESVTEDTLTEEEKDWRREILWFYYHHAINVAMWSKDKERALEYSEKALSFQDEDNPKRNRMTKLLNLLLQDKISEAEEWVSSIPSYILDDGNPNPEPQTGRELLEEYKNGEWFK